jgi:hypothetical protein
MTGAGLPIDLDNDGVPDFEVVEFICGDREGCVFVNPMVAGNGIKALSSAAQAGVYGLPVGAQGQFLTQFVRVTSTESAVGFMAEGGGYGGTFFSAGPWAHSTNKYLGFKFLIDGKIHYGWARLSVKMFKSSIVLTGYAYETIPNHRILEGHTQGLSASGLPPTDLLTPAPQPASLGMLACGADGLAVWRREDEVAGIDSAKQL